MIILCNEELIIIITLDAGDVNGKNCQIVQSSRYQAVEEVWVFAENKQIYIFLV